MTDASRTAQASVPVAGRMTGRGGPKIEKARDPRGSLIRLLAYLMPYKKELILVSIILALTTALDMASPYLMGLAIDHLGDVSQLIGLCAALLAAYVLTGAGQTLQAAIMARVSQNALKDLRQDLFEHLESLPLGYFDRHTHGELMSRLTNDIDAINRVISQNITQLLASLLTVVFIVVTVFLMNFWMAIGMLSIFPIMAILTTQIARRTRKGYRNLQSQLGQMNGMIEETITGERVIQAFSREGEVISDFTQINNQVRDTGMKAQFYSLLVPPMITALINIDIAVVAGLGGWLAIQNLVSVGMIASFITYARKISNPFRMLGDMYNAIQSALAGAERVFDVMAEKPEQNLEEVENFRAMQGEVEFDHVVFEYTLGVPVLEDVSFIARPGQTIALVGPTGAGKTTIINLLSRFYDIRSGSIRVDGQDIREIPREALRRQLSVVLQDTFLFSGSVIENIRYGRLDASDEECVRAAKMANADQFIRRLPEGYQTELSERAGNISQGQRQLLAIARAILADPRILILDEATSNVDTRTEVHIQQGMLRLMQGRTSFIIAHRLSTIRNADCLLVINDGRIVESGTHDVLIQQQGFYYHLYTSQFRGFPIPELQTNVA